MLALWQAEHVRKLLQERAGIFAEVIVIKTSGDKQDHLPFGQVGVKGMFIKELEDALLDGRVDLAVHSLKDVPSEVAETFTLAAICEREDVRDALISRSGETLDQLPRGARIGTSSLRRQSQLRHYRPDLQMCELRGNVDTRLAKLERGECDAIVLAKAGLDRLGMSDRITQVLPAEISLPAAGQGALAIEARAEDRELSGLLAALDHEATRRSVTAGTRVAFGAGRRLPSADRRLGSRRKIRGRGFAELDAVVLSPDGTNACGEAARVQSPKRKRWGAKSRERCARRARDEFWARSRPGFLATRPAKAQATRAKPDADACGKTNCHYALAGTSAQFD